MNLRVAHLILACVAALSATGAAEALKPRTLLTPPEAAPNLDELVPQQFGQWSRAPDVRLVEPPGSDTLAHEIYNQQVARGYVDPDGDTVMLLVAFGASQSDRLQLHRPEICYTAQGFRVEKQREELLSYRDGSPPLAFVRLITQRESRLEPVTYWMRIGYDVSTNNVSRQFLKVRYGLSGLIPDGALMRVSTIGLSPEESFKLQDRFIRDFLSALSPEALKFFVGDPSRAFSSPAR